MANLQSKRKTVSTSKIVDLSNENPDFERSEINEPRPHRLNLNITTDDLIKVKNYCLKNKVKQQDLAYKIFKEWINNK